MSSYWAGYYGTALVLNENEFEDFLNKYTEIRHPETFTRPYIDQLFEDCPIGEYDFIKSRVPETPAALADCFNITPVLHEETDGPWFAPFIRPNGDWNLIDGIKYTDIETDITRGENRYVIFSDCNLDSPRNWVKPAYPTYDSLVQEFKDKLQKYLPDDFDWNAHIGRFSYAAYA